MALLVGLGNPGARYAGHRHNIGFMALDAIARRHGGGAWKRRFQSEAVEANLDGVRCLLLKPQTYMNESGRAAAEAARFYKTPLTDIIVFHDELDLTPGKVRVKVGGGDAGHNGLRSLTAHLGAGYRRVRIGIGHPGIKEIVQHHVLSDFAKADRPWVDALCSAIGDHAGLLARGEDARFQNKVHLALEAVLAPPTPPPGSA